MSPPSSGTSIREFVDRCNDTARPYPRDASLVQLLSSRSRDDPEAPAVHDGRTELSYAELDRQSNAVAHRLVDAGIELGDKVGLHCAPRDAGAIVGLVGILKAGAAYVPIDPADPVERMADMIRDAGVRTVVVPAGQPYNLATVPRLVVEPGERDLPPVLPRPLTGADLAYVMFTSGSTGRPKAVGVRHRGVIRLVVNTDYLSLLPSDHVLQVASLSFDASTFEIWGALLAGARLVIADSHLLFSPDQFHRLLEDETVNVMFCTTAAFHQLATHRPGLFHGLRDLLVGGEALDATIARRVLADQPPERLINVYGPTENTAFTTSYLVKDLPPDARTVPIGAPIANTTCYILRDGNGLAEIGEQGELVTGGDGVAVGYLNDPQLTAEKFVPDVLRPDPAGRLYRTGDLCSWRPDGTIEFHGRRDAQIKLHGHRIELTEIETVLRRHPAVADAMVIRDQVGGPAGDVRLLALAVPTPGQAPPTTAELRSFVGARLPAYMVPASYQWTDHVPLTTHGKLDRSAVTNRSRSESIVDGATGDRADALDLVRTVWQDVLGGRGVVSDIAPRDTFFDVGGTSFDVLAVHARVVQLFDVPELTPVDLFTYPTLRGYTDHLSSLLRREPDLVSPDMPGRPIEKIQDMGSS